MRHKVCRRSVRKASSEQSAAPIKQGSLSGWTMICSSIAQLILTTSAYEGMSMCFVTTSTRKRDRIYNFRLVKFRTEVNKR